MDTPLPRPSRAGLWRLVAAAALSVAFLHVPAHAAAAPAATQLSPEQLVRQVTSDVLEAVHKDKALQAGDKQKAIALAEAKVLPHIDFEQMTRLILGHYWRSTTPQQRQDLVSAFRTFLVRIYSNDLGTYRGQTMKVEPLHMAPGATDVTVRNLYLSPGKAPVPIDYRMSKTPQGWKIYDIVVDRISLVQTYRSQFQDEIQREGVSGLIKQLQAMNGTASGS